MASCDVFALTSLLDGTSCVLNEAIGVGLPVICHRACGFADLVDETCGILIPPASPAKSAAAFADAIARLALDGNLYQKLCDGARARVVHIGAAQRARQMLAVYERVLGRPVVQENSPQIATAAVALCAS
jgi:glycosyltransferase involved in cell wall biosynthesis